MRAHFGPIIGAALWAALAAPVTAQDFDISDRDTFRAEVESYLLDNPSILMEMLEILEDERNEASARADKALVAEHSEAIFNDGFSYVAGNPEGDVTIVEFLDYQCGYCRRAHPQMTELLDEDGNIRLIIKELPILGPKSETAARAAIATRMVAGEDAYAELHNRLMTAKGGSDLAMIESELEDMDTDVATILEQMSGPEVTEELIATRRLADTLKISGTPTFIVGETLVRGFVPAEALADLVADIRAEG